MLTALPHFSSLLRSQHNYVRAMPALKLQQNLRQNLFLFSSALVAASVLPMQSEAVLVALLATDRHSVMALITVATVGNVLGSVINWYFGRYLLRFRKRRWFPSSDEQLERAQIWYRHYGRWSLLGSWLPVVGDPLTVIAGLMKEPIVPFVLLVTIAKGTRYVLLAAIALAWF
jgi:membrane protein YqaA with SNARE-associated domain